MLTNEEMKDVKKVNTKVTEWVEQDESEYDITDPEYNNVRKYFEHDQKPSDVPADKEYIEENLVTDLVFRLMGQLIGGRISPILKGGGLIGLPVKELFMNILEKNKFKEVIMENIANYFYVEGFAGLKVNFNPFRRSPWGLGFPEIYCLRPGTLLLDGNSIDLYHIDDMKRHHKIAIPLQWAKEQFPDQATDIVASFNEDRSGNQTEDFVDLYETQFKRNRLLKVDDHQEEIEEFFIVKNINKTVLVKPSGQADFVVPSRFKRSTLIPIFHTPRIKTGHYPFGPVWRIKDTQDQLNITASIILDAVKASIKMPIATTGAKNVDVQAIMDQLAKPNGYVNFEGANVKIHQLYAQPLVRPVVEWHEMSRHRFDEIKGTFAPDRGEATGDMSGKAISLLQMRGIEPEYVMKAHIEAGLSELGNVLLECIKYKMKYPFEITVKDGKNERKIAYNQPNGENNMEQLNLDDIDFKVEVEMNVLQKKEFEMNKAILMRNSGALALQDFLETMYPDTFKEKLENVTKENQAIQMVEMMKEVPPELLDQAMNQMKQFIQTQGQQQ